MKKGMEWPKSLIRALQLKRMYTVLIVLVALTSMTGCFEEEPDNPTPSGGDGNVPDELVGAWEYSSIDFEFWENYREGYYAGRNATPSREAMIFSKNGEAKFYRYEFAYGVYEELIDCTGKVTFNEDGTFTFYPRQGRKRFYDTRYSGHSVDRALTKSELNDPKLAGKRGYTYIGSSTPPAIRITVPGSAPYNWYKKP